MACRLFHTRGKSNKAGRAKRVNAISAGVRSEFAPPFRERKNPAQRRRVTQIAIYPYFIDVISFSGRCEYYDFVSGVYVGKCDNNFNY